ncbi:MAG: hypothetical protein GXX86_09250 [Propionibacterium sp.]|nr:hypothetical protein [Propionibacterium sp.]
MVQAVEATSEAEGLAGGLNAAAAWGGAGLEVIGAVMNPVAAIVKAPLEFLLDWIMSWCTPLRETVDFLLGDPAQIRANGDDWLAVAALMEDMGAEHRSTINDFPGWTGDGADTYRTEVHPCISEVFPGAGAAAKSFGELAIGCGAIIGALREIIWGFIVDLLAEVVASALLALASMIPTVGASIAAFTSWAALRFANLLRRLADKLNKGGKLLQSLGETLVKVAGKLDEAAAAMRSLDGGFKPRFQDIRSGMQGLDGLNPIPDSVGPAVDAAQGATDTSRPEQ